MNIRLTDENPIVAVLVFESGHVTVRFSNEVRLEISAETFEKMTSLYEEAKSLNDIVGVAIG